MSEPKKQKDYLTKVEFKFVPNLSGSLNDL
jgi:hypothetical protein